MNPGKLAAPAMDATASLQTAEFTQARRILRLFSYYRLVLSILLLGIYTGAGFVASNWVSFDFIGSHDARVYSLTAVIYMAQALVTALVLVERIQRHTLATLIMVLIDIVALSSMMYASGGVQTGMANLILISVAAGNILVQGRVGLMLAAVASISIIYTTLLLSLSATLSAQIYVQTGLIGAFYFAIAFLIQGLAQRIRRTEEVAQERARAITKLEKLNEHMIERMQTGVIAASSNGLIQTANLAARQLLGHGASDITTPGFLPGPLIELMQNWERNPLTSMTPLHLRDDGPQVQVSFTKLDSGRGSPVVIYLEDATRTTHQAQQLKLASLGRLTAGIAHEIRNPLGAISQAAQLLNESPDVPESEIRLTNIILEHSQRMNRIIENILELSRRKSALPVTLDLVSWTREVVRETIQLAGKPRPSITLETSEASILVSCDPSQMRQVLANLIDNGLRYSEKATGRRSVRVRCGYTRKQHQPLLEVLDDGPGISEEQRSQLFEPFYTTEAQGTGLGLYLSREICEANRARIDCLNMQTGACFRILFTHSEETTPHARV